MSASGLSSLGDLGLPEAAAPAYDNARILVRFRDDFAQSPQAVLAGSEIADSLGLVPGLHAVALNGPTVEEALAAYESSPAVLYAQPDYRIDLSFVSTDPGFTGEYLWGLDNLGQDAGTLDADIDAPEAWQVTTGSHEIIVAVIDSGVDYLHSDLAANIWVNAAEVAGDGLDNDGNGYVDDIHGYDFFNDDADPMDDNGHGTHVAGTIGAVANNGRGVVGVSPNVQLMPLKFLGADGSGSLSGAIAALNYAVTMGAQISNNSWGGGGYVGSLYEAIRESLEVGHLFVAAAGNENLNNDRYASYPANYALDNVISVAATDNRDQMASFTHWGATTVDLAAPGVDIVSTTPGNTYSYMSGTSMATPHVSGAAALLWASDPSLTYAEIKERLLTSADPIGTVGTNAVKPTATNGRLNAFNSLRPDLEWQSLAASASVYAGEAISIETGYGISGSAATADFSIAYVASSDTIGGNDDDVLLGTNQISAPDGKSVGSHREVNQFTAALAPGSYYVYARLDSEGGLNEHDDSNNYSFANVVRVMELPKVEIGETGIGVGAVLNPTNEGDIITLSAEVPAELTGALIEWQVSGGPVEVVGAVDQPTFQFRALDGSSSGTTYTVTLKVSATLNGIEKQFSDSTTVVVHNSAPTATPFVSLRQPVEGQAFEFGLEGVHDAAADVAAGFRYAFDLDGDNEFELVDAADPVASVTFADSGEKQLRVRVTDQDGASSVYSQDITVANVAPEVLALIGGTSITVGDVAQFSGTFADPGADSWHGVATIVTADGSTKHIDLALDSETKSFEFSHRFDSLGAHLANVTISDGQDESEIISLTIDVNPLEGDYTKDGVVDAADFVVWRKLNASRSEDDAEALATESADHSAWVRNFGSSVATASDTPNSDAIVIDIDNVISDAMAASLERAAVSAGEDASGALRRLSSEARDDIFAAIPASKIGAAVRQVVSQPAVLDYRPRLRAELIADIPSSPWSMAGEDGFARPVENVRDAAFETLARWGVAPFGLSGEKLFARSV